jgi:hypothetical protein
VVAPKISQNAFEERARKTLQELLAKADVMIGDNTEKIALLEGFLTEFGESQAAAKARAKIEEWKNAGKAPEPKPEPVVEPKQLDPVPEPKKTEPVAPAVTQVLYKCSFDTAREQSAKTTGSLDDQEAYGGKGVSIKSDPVLKTWHTAVLGVRPPEPVKVGENTWVRFACKLDGASNLMIHSGIGKGMFERHVYNVPQGKWTWITIKMSDYTRDIFKGPNKQPVPGTDFNGTAIMAGANSAPCTLHVDEFMIGDGPVPKDE